MVFRRLFSHLSQIISDFVETLFDWIDVDFRKIFDRRFTILDCRLIDFRLLDFFVEICYEKWFYDLPDVSKYKNKDDTSGALFTLSLSRLILISRRKEGARYIIFVQLWNTYTRRIKSSLNWIHHIYNNFTWPWLRSNHFHFAVNALHNHFDPFKWCWNCLFRDF